MSTIKTNQLAHTANGASVYTLPQTDGSAGQVLRTDGSGNLSWVNDSGKILQVVIEPKRDTSSQAVNSASYDYSSGLSNDMISKSITPTSATNKILIRASITVGIAGSKMVYAHLHKDGTAITLARGDTSNKQRISAGVYVKDQHKLGIITHEYLDTAGGTSAITYSYRFSHSDTSNQRTIYVNRSETESSTMAYARGYSSLTLMEIAA